MSSDPPGEPCMGEADDLKAENARLQRELDDALSVAAVAECVKESMIELERQKNSVDEELATMRQLLNEAHDEASSARTSYEHQLAKAKAVVGQLEGENHELRVRAKLGHGGGAAGVSEASVIDKETILGGAAVITDGAKSFARRMKSNLLPLGSSAQQQQQSSQPSEKTPSPVAPSTQQAGANLEDGMRRAYEDTEVLKAIVVPLEEQIGALKSKLRETDALLRQHEEKQSDIILGVDGLAKWLEGQSLEEAMAKVVERSASPDLEQGKVRAQENLYLGLMSARYSMLNRELASLRREHEEVVQLLERERSATKQLRQDAVFSNSELVKSQREHLAEVTRLQAVLTEEQKLDLTRSLSHERSVDSVSPLPPAKSPDTTVSSPDSSPSHEKISPVASLDGEGAASALSPSASTARMISSVEWQEMQKELEKVRALLGVGAGDSVVGSDQYRSLQAELIDVKKQKAGLAKTIDKMNRHDQVY